MTQASLEEQPRNYDRTIDSGLSLYRPGSGESLAEFCGILATISEIFPEIEVRRLQEGQRRPAVHLLDSAEVKRNRANIGHLVLSEVINEVFMAVPSVEFYQSVKMTEVYPTRDARTGAAYIILGMNDADENLLHEERAVVLSVIEQMAGVTWQDWSDKPMDMTIAYIPDSVRKYTEDSFLEAAERMLPIHVPLLPIEY